MLYDYEHEHTAHIVLSEIMMIGWKKMHLCMKTIANEAYHLSQWKLIEEPKENFIKRRYFYASAVWCVMDQVADGNFN